MGALRGVRPYEPGGRSIRRPAGAPTNSAEPAQSRTVLREYPVQSSFVSACFSVLLTTRLPS